jgi:VCBS repeat-containing protein
MIYRGDLNYNGDDYLTVFVDDLGYTGPAPSGQPSLTSRATVTIAVGPVNDPPTVTVPGAQQVDEDANRYLNTIVVGDPDTAQGTVTLTVTLQAVSGTLTVNPGVGGGVGSTGILNNGTGTVTLTGTPTEINNTFASPTGVLYRGNKDFNGADRVIVSANDNGNIGTGGALSASDTIDLTVAAVNDAPTIETPLGTLVFNEDATNAYIPLIVRDVDAGESAPGNVSVTLTVTHGKLHVREGVTGGLVAAQITANHSGSVSLLGTPVAIRATLLNTQGLRYEPDLNWNGNDSLAIAVDDLGNTGKVVGTHLYAAATVPIKVNPVNDAPLFTGGPTTATLSEGGSTVLANVSIADVDAVETAPGTVQVTLSLPTGTGTLYVTPDVTPGGVPAAQIQNNSSATVTLTGMVAEINATLAAPAGITYTTPNGDFNRLNYGGNVLLTATVNDQGRTGAGDALSASKTITLTIDPVNDNPVITVPVAQNLSEGGAKAITGVGVADVDFEELGPATLDVFLRIPAGQGTLSVATNVPGGLVAADITGNGTNLVKLTGRIMAINATLAATSGVTYTVPNPDFNNLNNGGPVVLTITTNDHGRTGAASGTDVSNSVTINVNAINDDPTITAPAPTPASALVADEDQTVTFTGATAISVGDVDLAEGANQMSVQLVANNGTLSLHGTPPFGLTFQTGDGIADQTMRFTGNAVDINAALDAAVFTPRLNFNGTTTLQITVNDQGNTGGGGGVNVTKVVNLKFNALNDFPVIVPPAALQATEDNGLIISGLQITDPDVPETPLVGQMVVTLTVDGGSLFVRDDIADTVTQKYLKPGNISGNGTGAVVLTATPDQINNTLAASGGLSYQPVPEFPAPALSDTVLFRVSADDQGYTGAGGVGRAAATFTITVTSVNDPPVVSVPGAQTTAEDTSCYVPGISVTDVDAGAADIQVTLTVAQGTLHVAPGLTGGLGSAGIQGNDSATVTLTGSIAAINTTLADPNGLRYAPNANANGIDQLVVVANDRGNSGAESPPQPRTDQKTVTITITRVNDAPTLTVPAAQTVDEDKDLPITSIAVADIDAAESTTIVPLPPNAGQIQLAASVTHGTLTVSTNVPGGVTSVPTNGQSAITLSGTPAQINATLLAGLTYRGAQNYFGPDAIVLNVSDFGNTGTGGTLQTSTTVTVTVSPINDAPNAGNDTGATAEDQSLTVAASTLLANDTPGPANEWPTQTVAIVAWARVTMAGGSVTYDGTNVVYTPAANFNGQDWFTYTITDDDLLSPLTATGTVVVTVTAVNDAPLPVADSLSGKEDTPLTVTAATLTTNDRPGPTAPAQTADDETRQVLTLSSVAPRSTHDGTVTVVGNLVTYVPAANFNGIDTFTYRVVDNGLTKGASDPRDAVGTVTVTVVAVNDGPQVTGPATVTIDEDVPQTIAGLQVSDVDVQDATLLVPPGSGQLEVTLTVTHGVLSVRGDVTGGIPPTGISAPGRTVVVSATPSQINTTLSATGGLVYTPDGNYNGSDSVVVTVNDLGQTGATNSSPSIVRVTTTLTIQPVNDPPQVAVPAPATLAEDASTALGQIRISDVDITSPATTTVQVTLSAANGRLAVNTGVSGGVLAGNVSNNGSSEVILIASLGAINQTLQNANGVGYQPNADFFGTDYVTVTVDDLGRTGSPGKQITRQSLTLTVTPVNDAPVAHGDPGPGAPQLTVSKSQVLIGSGRGVLANDTDVDGDSLTVVDADNNADPIYYRLTSSRGATVAIKVADQVVDGVPGSGGSFTYDPTQVPAFQRLREGESLVDTFTYRASDGTVASNLATVTITVTGQNDPPQAVGDQYQVADNAVLDTAASGKASVLANDTDRELDTLQVLVSQSDTTSALGAHVSMLSNGHFVYDPSASQALQALRTGQSLTDTFQYAVTDNAASGRFSLGTVTITVNGANTNPTAAPDFYGTKAVDVLQIAAPGVMANDHDPDSTVLSVTGQTLTSRLGASVTVGPDGSFTYDPRLAIALRSLTAGQTADDTFTYQLKDAEGGQAAGTVTVTVSGTPKPPYQNPISNTDVNASGQTSPIDALIVMNYINTHGAGTIPAGTPRPPYIDVNGDSSVTPVDALAVINYLNSQAAGGESSAAEGEAAAAATAPVLAAVRQGPRQDPVRDTAVPVASQTASQNVLPLTDPARQWVFADFDADRLKLEDAVAEIAGELEAAGPDLAARDLLFARLQS